MFLDENQKITLESYFSNENTKFITFDKTNYEQLETFKISKQPLNISQEICLWSNTEKMLKSFIDKYISDNIPTLYKTNDLRKVKNLEEAFKILDKNKPTHETNCLLFENPYKETIICELITICTEFDNNLEFTRNTLDIFLKKYDLKIFYSSYFKNLRNKLARLSDEEKILTFYWNLMKFHKYTADIPELLTLSSLFSVRSFPNVTLVVHLIGLFFERNENVKDIKVFILCMISKALTCFYGYSFDIFLISNCKFNCIESFHDLNFFVWEFNRNKRKDLKLKIGRNSIWVTNERKYLKSVLMIYLYNHLLYCKYYSIGYESIKLVQEGIEKVMKSEDCIGCLLNEFLRVIQLCSDTKIAEN